jgi:DNA repair protein RadC
MSLEKRRETRENRKMKELETSSFRRLNFAPLQEVKTVKKPKIAEQEKLIEELTEVEKDVLKIAEIILKLKRYDADFDIEVASEAELQKFPIIEKLYAKSIAKLAYKKGYSKEEIFLAIRSLEQKSYIVTKERRTKLEILNNEKLSKILRFIKNNPQREALKNIKIHKK